MVIDQIRAISYYENVPIIFIPEGAPAQEGQHLAAMVSNSFRLVCMHESTNGSGGVPVTADSKRSLVFATQAVLNSRTLQVADRFVAVTNKALRIGNAVYEETDTYLLDLLCGQLKRYHARVQSTQDGTSERVYLTGKSYGNNDDMAMAFMMLWYWSSQFYQSNNTRYDVLKRLIESRNAERGVHYRLIAGRKRLRDAHPEEETQASASAFKALRNNSAADAALAAVAGVKRGVEGVETVEETNKRMKQY